MAYEVEYTATALRQLRKLDRQVARRIVDYLDEASGLDDPRSRGKALVGDRAGIWRHRVGDYRVLCDVHPVREELHRCTCAVQRRPAC